MISVEVLECNTILSKVIHFSVSLIGTKQYRIEQKSQSDRLDNSVHLTDHSCIRNNTVAVTECWATDCPNLIVW